MDVICRVESDDRGEGCPGPEGAGGEGGYGGQFGEGGRDFGFGGGCFGGRGAGVDFAGVGEGGVGLDAVAYGDEGDLWRDVSEIRCVLGGKRLNMLVVGLLKDVRGGGTWATALPLGGDSLGAARPSFIF